ncbi:MAG: hypothetical protein VX874_15770 [Pseudomonadota bacterium]|nr:hypothetical protein [Pseudomonadota bacterium]
MDDEQLGPLLNAMARREGEIRALEVLAAFLLAQVAVNRPEGEGPVLPEQVVMMACARMNEVAEELPPDPNIGHYMRIRGEAAAATSAEIERLARAAVGNTPPDRDQA